MTTPLHHGANMQPLLYAELVPFYRLLDPTEDHADEAAHFAAVFERAGAGGALLELGAGAGNNAFHLKRRFRATLTDISEPMLGLSRDINPECEHLAGDMRSLRLDREFDAVLVHDAIAYMTTRADLRAAVDTAFIHTRPGGTAIFAPDCLRETFTESTEVVEGEGGGRALRGIEWDWDPDPSDDTTTAEYAFLLREGGKVRAVHDRHVCGLFARSVWDAVLASVGFRVTTERRPIGEPGPYFDEVFVCHRPA